MKISESIRGRYYRDILKKYPRLDDTVPPEDHLGVLQALWWHRRHARALRFCRDVCIPALEGTDEIHDLSQFWSYLGWTAVKVKRFDEAEKAYRKAMRLASWDWEPRLGLGRLALERRDTSAATRFLKQAFDRDCLLLPSATVEALEALKRNKMKKFRECYLKARNAMDHLEEIIRYRIHGKAVPESEYYLGKAMRECPDDPNILAFAGYVLLELAEKEKAGKHLEKALKLVPHHPWAHCGMAKLAAERKDWPAVYSHLTASVIAADWNKFNRKYDDFRQAWKYGQFSPGHFVLDLVGLLADLHNHGWEIEGIDELAKVRGAKGYDLFLRVKDMLLKKRLKPL